MEEEIIAYLQPKLPVSESFRTLRTNIQFTSIDKKVRTILVTSCFPGEGKSWVSSNLAITFAQTGKKVLLIDADMRKGRQNEIFKVKQMPGLSNILSMGDDENKGDDNIIIGDSVQKTEVENLSIIAIGNMPPNPSELVSSNRMGDVLERLKYDFDIIILDGTPSSLVSDSIALSRIVDTTLIVSVAKKTPREQILKIKKAIENVGGKIGGLVLNKVPLKSSEYKYGYGYGYGYGTYMERDLEVKKKGIFSFSKKESTSKKVKRQATRGKMTMKAENRKIDLSEVK